MLRTKLRLSLAVVAAIVYVAAIAYFAMAVFFEVQRLVPKFARPVITEAHTSPHCCFVPQFWFYPPGCEGVCQLVSSYPIALADCCRCAEWRADKSAWIDTGPCPSGTQMGGWRWH